MTLDVSKIIEERQPTHGDYASRAELSQEIKSAMQQGGWLALPCTHREALEMIAVKISRILMGNPNNKDHWEDIAGYAMLVSKTLKTRDGGVDE